MPESVCVEDFCGYDGVGQTSFSADYFYAEKLLYFTGDWGVNHIPPMPSDTVPTNEECFVWARAHGGCW